MVITIAEAEINDQEAKTYHRFCSLCSGNIAFCSSEGYCLCMLLEVDLTESDYTSILGPDGILAVPEHA